MAKVIQINKKRSNYEEALRVIEFYNENPQLKSEEIK